MSVGAGGRWTSAGRVLLVAWLQADENATATELARRCGVTPAAISALATGVHRWPSLPLALALEKHAAIDPHAWEQRARISTEVEAPAVTLQTKPPSAA